MEVELPREAAALIAGGLRTAAHRADRAPSDVDKAVGIFGDPEGQFISISIPIPGKIELY